MKKITILTNNFYEHLKEGTYKMTRFLALMISIAVLAASPAFAMDDETNTAPSRKAPLEPLPPYDWSKNFHITITSQAEVGNQVLHIKSTNKPFTNSPESI